MPVVSVGVVGDPVLQVTGIILLCHGMSWHCHGVAGRAWQYFTAIISLYIKTEKSLEIHWLQERGGAAVTPAALTGLVGPTPRDQRAVGTGWEARHRSVRGVHCGECGAGTFLVDSIGCLA